MENIEHKMYSVTTSDMPVIIDRAQVKSYDSSTVLDICWHEDVEIVYALKGNGRISCDFTELPIKEGELFVINSDVFHGFAAENEEGTFEYYYIIADKDFCKNNGFDVSRIRFAENIKDDEAVEKFKAIIVAHEIKNEYKGIAVRAATLDLIYHLCTRYISKTPAVKKKKATNIDNIRSAIVYIRENLSKKLTTADLAKASGISEYYFIREFKRITHYTPVTYINIVRCSTARRMLYEGDKNVGEVAVLCGFDNMPYFTKTFKKYTGVLPSDVKRDKKGKS